MRNETDERKTLVIKVEISRHLCSANSRIEYIPKVLDSANSSHNPAFGRRPCCHGRWDYLLGLGWGVIGAMDQDLTALSVGRFPISWHQSLGVQDALCISFRPSNHENIHPPTKIAELYSQRLSSFETMK